ncbi:MAG TPA: DUF721 domain-containing protein [Gaiellaceae bacterium]|nr:DUF721 domain-containing protein [Gaiellaceae bacterium]
MERLSDTVRGELGRFGPPGDLGDILERWPAAVGAAIAQNAWPSRVGRDGTLHVNTADSVWAFELGQRAADIAGRLGIEAIRFAPGPLASGEEVPAPALHRLPSADQTREAARIAAAIEDPSLRESIERAVSLALARGPVDRPL